MKKIILLCVASTLSCFLWSQNKSIEDTTVNNLESIVITATKSEIKTLDVPVRVSTIPIYSIKSNNVFTLDDALTHISGVTVSRHDGVYDKKSDVSLRGMGHEQGRTLILYDGIPLNKLSTGSVNWNMINPQMINRVEVVKGPGSSIYGGNAMGGMINIISKTPEDGVHGYAGMDYGSYNTIGANLGINFKKSSIFGGADGFFRKGDGFNAYPQEMQDSTTIAAPLLEYRGGGFIGWNIDDNNTIRFNGGYYDGKRGTGDRIFYNNKDTGEQEIIDAKGRYQDQEYRLNYKGNGGNASWEVAAFFIGEKMSETKYKSKNLYDVISFRDDWGVWANYSHKIGSNVRLSGGLEYKGGRVDGNDIYRSASDVVTNKGGSNTYSAYIQGEFSFLDNHFFILPSLRYDLSDFFYGSYTIKNPSKATSAMQQFVNENLAKDAPIQGSFSPKIALQYKFTDNSRIYASFSSGWRPGSLEDRCWFGVMKNGFIVANPDLKAERIYTYELGGDVLLVGDFNISASLYYSDGRDYIYQVSTGRTFMDGSKKKDELKLSNIARVEIAGAEMDLAYNNVFVKGLDLFANYTFNYSRIKEYNKTQENDADLTGKYLTYIPKHQTSVGATYRSKWINANIAYRYMTDQFMSDDNSTEEGDVIKAHGILDAKIWYSFRNMLTLSVGGSNLINTKYLVSKDQLTMGRYLFVKLEFKF